MLRAMTRRPAAIATLSASILLAACGGSTHNGSATSSATSSHAATSSGASASTTTAGVTSTTVTAVTSGRPPEVPAGKRKSSATSKPTAPATNVRLPATFAIKPGGSLTPPALSAPKGVAIQLQLRNLDSRSHSVVLDTPKRYAFRLQPQGLTNAVITGLAKGTYRILIDGTERGQLVIGSNPGP
jgi:hypothetical protein